MWEVKYARQNGSIDFMWYGSLTSWEDAEWRFRCLADIGLKPISLREIRRVPTDHEYLAMLNEANTASDRYQVITYAKECGAVKKRKYAFIDKAARAAQGYVNKAEPLNCGPLYDGVIVYDTQAQCVVEGFGLRFPDSVLPLGCKK